MRHERARTARSSAGPGGIGTAEFPAPDRDGVRPFRTTARWRAAVSALFLFVCPLLGGCRYERLLAFKESLKQIDQNVEFRRSNDGLYVTFKHPILNASDLAWLGYSPSHESNGPNGVVTWDYKFAMTQASPDAHATSFAVTLAFRAGRLESVHFPDLIVAMAPEDLPRTFLLALGFAEVDLVHRRLHFGTGRAAQVKAIDLPDYYDVRNLFGEGHRRTVGPNAYSVSYRFDCRTKAGNLTLVFFGVFRRAFDTMQTGGLAFGPYQILFSDDSITIEAVSP